MFVDEERCEAAGLDPKRVASIARRISRAALESQAMGLKIFGGSGSGDLRLFSRGVSGVVATLDGKFDGGDGGDDWQD